MQTKTPSPSNLNVAEIASPSTLSINSTGSAPATKATSESSITGPQQFPYRWAAMISDSVTAAANAFYLRPGDITDTSKLCLPSGSTSPIPQISPVLSPTSAKSPSSPSTATDNFKLPITKDSTTNALAAFYLRPGDRSPLNASTSTTPLSRSPRISDACLPTLANTNLQPVKQQVVTKQDSMPSLSLPSPAVTISAPKSNAPQHQVNSQASSAAVEKKQQSKPAVLMNNEKPVVVLQQQPQQTRQVPAAVPTAAPAHQQQHKQEETKSIPKMIVPVAQYIATSVAGTVAATTTVLAEAAKKSLAQVVEIEAPKAAVSLPPVKEEMKKEDVKVCDTTADNDDEDDEDDDGDYRSVMMRKFYR